VDQGRQKREVVVLHHHDGIGCVGLLGQALPVGGTENRSSVAQRPQPLIGQAVVIAVFLLLAQLNQPDVVGGRLVCAERESNPLDLSNSLNTHCTRALATTLVSISIAAAIAVSGASAGCFGCRPPH
jgi:hypothetical protein